MDHLQDEESPDFYRRRYFELKEKGQKGGTRKAQFGPSGALAAIPPSALLGEGYIPPGWYWAAHLKRGEALRLANDQGSPGISALAWSAADPSERLNPADSIKVQWTARLSQNRVLLSDMGRVLLSVIGDTHGLHDCLAGGSTPQSNVRLFGDAAVRRNTRDNFILAAAKHGLGPRDVGPCITFFAPVVTDEAGSLVWDHDAPAGGMIDLRAEMDVIVALSNCPHPLSPNRRFEAKPVLAQIWKAPDPASDVVRHATDEAARAFENTDAGRPR
jgi:urea carboxylase-associated protein 2